MTRRIGSSAVGRKFPGRIFGRFVAKLGPQTRLDRREGTICTAGHRKCLRHGRPLGRPVSLSLPLSLSLSLSLSHGDCKGLCNNGLHLPADTDNRSRPLATTDTVRALIQKPYRPGQGPCVYAGFMVWVCFLSLPVLRSAFPALCLSLCFCGVALLTETSSFFHW
jgi:hypothetical protein